MNKLTCKECKICSENSIFKHLNASQRLDLSSSSKNLIFYNKEKIFSVGELPDNFYIVKSGFVKLTSTDNEGKEQLLRISKAGDMLSYRSIFANEQYSGTAYSVKKTIICAFPKRTIYNIIDTNNDFRDEFIKMLANKLKDAEKRMIQISYKNIESRIAFALLDFITIYGLKDDGKTLMGPIYRKDIAQFIGISVESTIRLIKKLKIKNLIDIKNKDIILLDINALKEIANL